MGQFPIKDGGAAWRFTDETRAAMKSWTHGAVAPAGWWRIERDPADGREWEFSLAVEEGGGGPVSVPWGG